MNAPVVVSLWSDQEDADSFLSSGCMLDSQYVLTAKHVLSGKILFVQTKSGRRRIQARLLQANDHYDAAILELAEPLDPTILPPVVLQESARLDGTLVEIRAISPLHKTLHIAPNYAIGSYDERNGHYELSPDNAKGHSGGVVIWRDMIVGLLVARAQNDPLCRAISFDRLVGWMASLLPGLRFPPQPPVWQAESSPFLTRVIAFRESYLHDGMHAEPFGGRDKEMSKLDGWLNGAGTVNRMLVSGPTGRGKSALVVRWTERIALSAAWKVVFVPISIRFETHRAAVFYEILACQLAFLAGKRLVLPTFDPEEFYSGHAQSLIGDLCGKNENVLIVIDGIDEALDGRFNAMMFRRKLPPNVKILCSAREQANDNGPGGWLKRLEWERNGVAATLPLSLLGKVAVGQVLDSVGLSLVDADALVERIVELSEGEPLLVKLFAEDLFDAVERGHPITPSQLAGFAKGFGPYFERVLEALRKGRSDASSAAEQDGVEATLLILASAYGPLTSEALIGLVCDLNSIPIPFSAERFVAPISRFISGNGLEGSGYVLNHPRLGQFLCEERFEVSALRRAHAAFRRWGREEAGKRDEDSRFSISPYLLQHFARHVIEADDDRVDLWRCLSNSWRSAWLHYEGGYHCYANSLLSILWLLKHTGEGWSFSESLRFRIKVALCVSSVKSIGANVPSLLLRFALETEKLTLRQAKDYVELQSFENQPSYYVEIFPYLVDGEVDRVLSSIRSLPDSGNRAHFLARIASHLPIEGREEVVREVQKLAGPFETSQTFPIGVELAEILSLKDLQALVRQAEILSPQPEFVTLCALAMAKLCAVCLRRSEAEFYDRTLRSCLSMLDGMGDTLSRAELLCQLSELLPQMEITSRIAPLHGALKDIACDPEAYVRRTRQQPAGILDFELTRVQKICLGFEILRTRANPSIQLECAMTGLKVFASRVLDFHICHAFSFILPLLDVANKPEIAKFAFDSAGKLPTGNNRTHAFLALMKDSPAGVRTRLVEEALVSARLIEDNFSQLNTLIGLAVQLPDSDRVIQSPVLRREMLHVKYVLHQGELALRLAVLGPDREALQAIGIALINKTDHRSFSVAPLLHALKDLSADIRRTIFRNFIDEQFGSTDVMLWLNLSVAAEVAPDLWTRRDLRKALVRCRELKESYQRSHFYCSLMRVASRLDYETVIDEAFETVPKMQEERLRLPFLSKLVMELHDGDTRRHAVDEEWVRAINAGVDFQPGEVASAYPLLTAENQRNALAMLSKKVDDGVDLDGSIRLKLAEISTDAQERQRLHNDALAVMETSNGDARCNAVVSLLLKCENEETLRRALLVLFENPTVGRATILAAIDSTATVLARSGSVDLIRHVMADIRETAEWWP